jgi:hypothetical protein
MFHCKKCGAVIENEIAYEVHKLNHELRNVYDALQDIAYWISEIGMRR